MKLNADCIRDVLLRCEEIPLNGKLSMEDLCESLGKYNNDDVVYTCMMLSEGELITVITRGSGRAQSVVCVYDLTYKGHQFLNTVRPATVWEKTKSVLSPIGSWSFSLIRTVAETFLLDHIGNFLP